MCSNPCRVMTVTTLNKFKAKLNGTLDITILLPRKVSVTKDVFVKTFTSFGKSRKDKTVFFNEAILVAEIGGYLGMTLGVSIMDLQLVSNKILWPIFCRKSRSIDY